MDSTYTYYKLSVTTDQEMALEHTSAQFGGADSVTYHYVTLAKGRERPPASKLTPLKFHMGKLELTKLNDMEVNSITLKSRIRLQL
jgi:hypothetical protein